MNSFLNNSKQILNQLQNAPTVLNIVLGNPSCDLDSAISPLVYSYLIHKEIENNGRDNEKVLPVLNIPEEDFPLKTEVTHFLTKRGIDHKNLTFLDHINFSQINSSNLRIHLTDHHVLTEDWIHLKSSVVSVIDHRPQDPNWLWANIYTNIEQVGCCCTLVANEILKRMPDILTQEIAELLYHTINFSSDAQRFTSLDVDIVQILKENYIITIDNKSIFNELVNARNNITHLTALQLLRKDLKVLRNKVALPGFPILVVDFIQKSDALCAVDEFCKKNKYHVIILMGLFLENDLITRDLGVYSNTDCVLRDQIVDALKQHTEQFQLNEIATDVVGLVLFAQRNNKVTRKTILPIIEGALGNDGNTC